MAASEYCAMDMSKASMVGSPACSKNTVEYPMKVLPQMDWIIQVTELNSVLRRSVPVKQSM